MIKNLLFLLFSLYVLLTFFGCKKSTIQNSQSVQEFDTLTDADATLLAAIPDTSISIDSILLDNGQSVFSFLQANDPNFLQMYPSSVGAKSIARDRPIVNGLSGTTNILGLDPLDQRGLFIGRMLVVANYLVTRSNFVTSSGQPHGLAYVSGSKDIDIPNTPSIIGNNIPGCLKTSLYGLDCSGLIYQMTSNSFLKTDYIGAKDYFNVAHLSDITGWNLAFQNSDDYKDLIMVDEGDQTEVEPEDIQLGDIIIWRGTSGHVGFCIPEVDQPTFYPGLIFECGGNRTDPECQHNADANQGPKIMTFAGIKAVDHGNYEIFRVVATTKNACIFTYRLPVALYSGQPYDPEDNDPDQPTTDTQGNAVVYKFWNQDLSRYCIDRNGEKGYIFTGFTIGIPKGLTYTENWSLLGQISCTVGDNLIHGSVKYSCPK